MANKLIKGIDEEIWRKFTGFCKIKGVKIGEEIGKILKEYLDKRLEIKK